VDLSQRNITYPSNDSSASSILSLAQLSVIPIISGFNEHTVTLNASSLFIKLLAFVYKQFKEQFVPRVGASYLKYCSYGCELAVLSEDCFISSV